MAGVADRIMRRVHTYEKGQWVCAPKDFLDLGSRAAVDQALSRLTRKGQLRRVGRGLYDCPRISRILKQPAPVDLDAVVKALAKRYNVCLMPDGLVDANRLGLTNAVPARASYWTNGASRTIKLDGLTTIRFRHASRHLMQWQGKSALPVVRALYWLGPVVARNGQVVPALQRCLPEAVKQNLRQYRTDLPDWMVPLAHSLTADLVMSA